MKITSKKTLVVAGILLLAAGLLLPIHAARAIVGLGGTNSSGIGKVLGWITGASQTPSIATWSALLLLVQGVLSILLSIAAFFLNNIFYYAVVLNPSNMPVVQEGWSIVRDIANSLFILIVLWIALTIIFDVENLGGKKLLTKVIIAALLINFSLAFSGVIFGVANALAIPFKEAIGSTDVTGLIVGRVNLQSANAFSPSSGTDLKDALDREGGHKCGFSALSDLGQSDQGCLGASIAGSFASGFIEGFTKYVEYFSSFSLAIQDFFYIAVITTLVGAIILLLLRIIWMVFLGIVAPAAFLALAAPDGRRYFDQWLKRCLCWAFVAPVFYFLFYMSLKILVVMTDAPILTTGPKNFVSNMLQMLPLVVFLAFMWFAIVAGKQMGCKGAEIAIGIGKQLASWGIGSTLGVARQAQSKLYSWVGKSVATAALGPAGATLPGVLGTGLGSKLGGSIIGGLVGGKAGPLIDRLASRKSTSLVGRALRGAATGFQKGELDEIEGHRNSVLGLSKDQAFARFNGSLFEKEKIGLLQRFAEKGELEEFKTKNPEGYNSTFRSAVAYGAHESIVKSDPSIIDGKNFAQLVPKATSEQDAINKTVSKVEDKLKMSDKAKGDDRVVRAILMSVKGQKELERIGREDSFLLKNMMRTFGKTAQEQNRILEGLKDSMKDSQGNLTPQNEQRAEARFETIKRFSLSPRSRMAAEDEDEDQNVDNQTRA